MPRKTGFSFSFLLRKSSEFSGHLQTQINRKKHLVLQRFQNIQYYTKVYNSKTTAQTLDLGFRKSTSLTKLERDVQRNEFHEVNKHPPLSV